MAVIQIPSYTMVCSIITTYHETGTQEERRQMNRVFYGEKPINKKKGESMQLGCFGSEAIIRNSRINDKDFTNNTPSSRNNGPRPKDIWDEVAAPVWFKTFTVSSCHNYKRSKQCPQMKS